jgi:SAM-dependent methyltransferase
MGERRVRDTYDTIAAAYDEALRDELAGKPLDRALLAALVELSTGIVADVGCGPGHVTRYLARHHPAVVGVDLSPAMISIARAASPELRFEVGSMLDLPVADGAWSGLAAFYSIIHFGQSERVRAFREFARALTPGGWALVAFHVSADGQPAGSVHHLSEWFGSAVDVDALFIDPADVSAELTGAGFTIASTTLRAPLPGVEFPSHRCYLLAQRA